MVGEWHWGGYSQETTNFLSTDTIRVWILKRELWHRLENKPERAYRASVSFVSALRWGFRECVRGSGGCSGCFLVYLCGLLFYIFLEGVQPGRSTLQEQVLASG